MDDTKITYRMRSAAASRVVVAFLLVLAGCGGGNSTGAASSSAPTHTTPAQPAIGTIAQADATVVNTPYIAGNAVQHYCDCQTGAASSCVAGNDTTGSGTQANPYQTLDAAVTWLTGAAHRTVALCQGGSFTSTHTGQFVYTLSATGCAAGSICNELREYPFQGSGPKPLITNPAGYRYLFNFPNGGAGGYRFMNLKLQGAWDPSSNNGNLAFFLYAGTYVHDIAIENVDMDSFDLAIQDAVNANNGITIIGNHFTNSAFWAYLGGSSNLTIADNSFVNNGSDNKFDHAVYLSTNQPVSNVSIVGNFISGFSTASGNTNCMGSPLVGHAAVTNLAVSGNVVMESTTADPGCWGIGFTNTTNATGAIFLRNALFSDNVVVNGGNSGIVVDNCPFCFIQNNLVLFQDDAEAAGITSPADRARVSPPDDVETNASLVNNTVYLDSTSAQGMHGGVVVGAEGSGYTIANNTVVYAGTSHGTNQTNCFAYPLPLASYAFINNNNCYSHDTATNWVVAGTTPYTLASWQTYAATAGATGTGFDNSTTSSYADPGWSFATPLALPALDETKTGAQLFAAYFTPSGLPLVGAGNAANAPALDALGVPRPNPPSIGAYQ